MFWNKLQEFFGSDDVVETEDIINEEEIPQSLYGQTFHTKGIKSTAFDQMGGMHTQYAEGQAVYPCGHMDCEFKTVRCKDCGSEVCMMTCGRQCMECEKTICKECAEKEVRGDAAVYYCSECWEEYIELVELKAWFHTLIKFLIPPYGIYWLANKKNKNKRGSNGDKNKQ